MLGAIHNSEIVMTSCLNNNFVKNLNTLYRELNNKLKYFQNMEHLLRISFMIFLNSLRAFFLKYFNLRLNLINFKLQIFYCDLFLGFIKSFKRVA
jgi:hypothetical protein